MVTIPQKIHILRFVAEQGVVTIQDVNRYLSFCYLNNERKHIKGFIKYLRSNEIKSFYTVTEKTLLNYREYLWEEFVHAREDGLVVRSQKERLCSVVRLFNYLEKEGILKVNPSRPIDWRQYYKEIFEKKRGNYLKKSLRTTI